MPTRQRALVTESAQSESDSYTWSGSLDAVERGAWTDERLDDLADAMRSGFTRVDQDIRDLRGEVGTLGSQLRSEVSDLRVDLGGQIEALRLTMLGVGGALLVGLGGVIAAILANGA